MPVVFINLSTADAQSLTKKLIAEDPVALAQQARTNGDIVRGAILFHQGNINCAKCHRASAEKDRIGPDLSRMDRNVTDQFIVESILQPSKILKKGFETVVAVTVEGETLNGTIVKKNDDSIVIRDVQDVDKLYEFKPADIDEMQPGTTSSMPDRLADELKDRQQFLDLLRYIIVLHERGPDLNQNVSTLTPRRELSDDLHGLVLMQKLNCAACHQSKLVNFPVASKQAPRLKWSAKRLNPSYIESFIADPHVAKPGTTMPALLEGVNNEIRKKSALAITQFLTRKAVNEFQNEAIDGEAVHRGYELFHSVGCVACHSPRMENAIEKPLADSTPLGDLFAKYNISGLTEFLENPLAVRPAGHMPNMTLSHREALDVSNFLLQASNKGVADWKPDPELAERGELLFKELNCANCHSEFLRDGNPTQTTKIAFGNVDARKGCHFKDNQNSPNYHLSVTDRAMIQTALKNSPVELSDKHQIEVTLSAFNCVACHARDDFGGIVDARNPHFQSTNLNLGEQGRIPPSLSGVGAKVNAKWMRDVLVNGRSIRPYVETRMPQYGEENVGHLIKLFEKSDSLANTEFAKFTDQKAMREQGHVLAGSKGLNCVACHTYQYKISDTMPAVDLTEMTERLKKDWFYQYMLAPQQFSPNTVMPSFWPGRNAIRKDLEGTPEEQIEALWQYLIDGRQARAPRGVVREPLEIVVSDEAQMLRRSYQGIGKRGIGVGYPGNINIAFDAEQMRLASVWKGKFVDPSGVWTGQGHGTARPMSRAVNFPKGPDLDSKAKPWIVDGGRPPLHQFKGYDLDESQRPTFRYDYSGVQVTDFFTEVVGKANKPTYLRRHVSLSTAEKIKTLRFRVASSQDIGQAENRIFTINNQLRVRIAPELTAMIVDFENEKQLEIPVSLVPGKVLNLVIEYFPQ